MTLIGRLRVLIADPTGDSQVFSDDELTDALDRYRIDEVQVILQPTYFRTTTTHGYTLFKHPGGLGDWGEDAALQDALWVPVTADATDLARGQWSFTTPRSSAVLYLTGFSFDIWGSAADLLEAWAARVKLEFSFSSDGQRFDRQQQSQALLALAKQYRRRQRPRIASMVRPDVDGIDPLIALHANLKPLV